MNSADMPLYNDLSAMKERHDTIKMQINDLQQQLKIVKNSIQDMFEDTARMQLAQQGKDFGQTTINAGTHKVTVDIRKRVEWDQDALIDAFNQMDPDTAKHYATVKYAVAEAKYKAAPPEIVGLLSEARTVHLQGVSVDIEDRETD